MSTIWPELVTALHPADVPPPGSWQNCYETKFALASLLRPKSIFEIGVRTGYSALAFLKAVPEARYVGIDPNEDTHGGFRGAIGHARRLLAPYHARIHEMTSAAYAATCKPGSPDATYDLIHVDGDHSLAGCTFDLDLAWRLGFQHLLVDDYTGIDEVRTACDRFGESHLDHLTRIIVQDGHHGAVLFHRQETG